VIEIDDPADPRVGDFYRLNDPDLRRRRETPGRDGDGGGDGGGDEGGAGEGFLVAEGALVIRQLLRSRYPVRSLLLTARGLADLEGDLAAVDAPVYLVDQRAMTSVTGFHFHRGALAAASRRPPVDLDEATDGADLVVVVEGVNDNENLGGLFRNAAAFGAGAVVLDRTSADPLYRRCIRVSMGQALRLPFARVQSAPEAIGRLRAAGFEVLALTPAPGADDIAGVAPRPRQALVVGAEGPGLSAAALAAADRRVRIPMAAGVDSLNVATAAAVALSRLARTP
jgi:tRNA G18 (ribose-2'-O)-methylase SpoU